MQIEAEYSSLLRFHRIISEFNKSSNRPLKRSRAANSASEKLPASKFLHCFRLKPIGSLRINLNLPNQRGIFVNRASNVSFSTSYSEGNFSLHFESKQATSEFFDRENKCIAAHSICMKELSLGMETRPGDVTETHLACSFRELEFIFDSNIRFILALLVLQSKKISKKKIDSDLSMSHINLFNQTSEQSIFKIIAPRLCSSLDLSRFMDSSINFGFESSVIRWNIPTSINIAKVCREVTIFS